MFDVLSRGVSSLWATWCLRLSWWPSRVNVCFQRVDGGLRDCEVEMNGQGARHGLLLGPIPRGP